MGNFKNPYIKMHPIVPNFKLSMRLFSVIIFMRKCVTRSLTEPTKLYSFFSLQDFNLSWETFVKRVLIFFI